MGTETPISMATVGLYQRYLVDRARADGPRSILNNVAIGLHIALGFVFFPLIPVQFVTTFVLGLLDVITFGILGILLAAVFWWPFFGFLLGTSLLWGKVGIARPVLLLPGVVVAEVAHAVVALMPAHGEWQARGLKLALCESWPHSHHVLTEVKRQAVSESAESGNEFGNRESQGSQGGAL